MEEKILGNESKLENGVSTEGFEAVSSAKRYFETTKRDIIFAVLLTVFSVLLSAFGLWGGLRAGFTVSTVLILATATAYLITRDVKIKPFPLACGVLALIISASFTLTSNGSVRFYGFISILLLSLAWLISLVDDRPEKGDLGLFSKIFMPIFEICLPNMPKTVASVFTFGGNRKATFLKALLGIALAVPVLLVVVPLLISSDVAFSGLATRLVSDLASTFLKLLVGLIIALMLVSYCVSLKKCELCERRKSNFKGIDNVVTVSFLSAIAVCYLTYLFSQLAYFFSAFKGFLPEDYSFTAAEYARRGFFEMSVIAAINFCLIFAVLLASKKENGKICIASRVLCTFIGVFTLIIIATAISKMVLYISRFGMTVLRITTSAFMVFLSVVFISLMLRVFISKIKVLKTAFISAGIVLAVLGTFNVNNVVASYNYNAFKSGALEEIDTFTLYELGDEGIPYLIKLTSDEDEKASSDARQELVNVIASGEYYGYELENYYNSSVYELTDKKYKPYLEFSIPRNRAFLELDKFLAENPDFLNVEHETNDYIYLPSDDEVY